MRKIKYAAVLVVLTLVFSMNVYAAEDNVSESSDSIDVAGYLDANFYSVGQPEIVDLQLHADTITLYATCDGENVTDTLVFHIIDKTREGYYDSVLPFPADGTYTTYSWYLPIGEYIVYFTGDEDILHTYALAVFSMFDTSILSIEADVVSTSDEIDLSEMTTLTVTEDGISVSQ